MIASGVPESLSATRRRSCRYVASRIIVIKNHRKPESKQMLDSYSREWQKWQRMGCLTFGRVKVNKICLYGSLLLFVSDHRIGLDYHRSRDPRRLCQLLGLFGRFNILPQHTVPFDLHWLRHIFRHIFWMLRSNQGTSLHDHCLFRFIGSYSYH